MAWNEEPGGGHHSLFSEGERKYVSLVRSLDPGLQNAWVQTPVPPVVNCTTSARFTSVVLGALVYEMGKMLVPTSEGSCGSTSDNT